jgi:hypothetical protein
MESNKPAISVSQKSFPSEAGVLENEIPIPSPRRVAIRSYKHSTSNQRHARRLAGSIFMYILYCALDLTALGYLIRMNDQCYSFKVDQWNCCYFPPCLFCHQHPRRDYCGARISPIGVEFRYDSSHSCCSFGTKLLMHEADLIINVEAKVR